MKSRFSIKNIFIFAVIFFSASLILGYSLLSARFFSQGVIRVITDNMVNGVDTYHRSMARNSTKGVDYFGNLMITRDWKQVPAVVRRTFPSPVPATGKLYMTKESGILNRSDPNYYILAVPKGGIIYYVCQWIGFSTPPGTFGWNSNENIKVLIVISCCIGMALATVLWLIIRRIATPMAALSFWAKGLDKQRVSEDLPDFYYRELNELAALIREKIGAEQERIERDRQFLHYASHELRTPVTVIAQNIEVLKKAGGLNTDRAREMEKNALKRLSRAADNMGTLMETLLWMGRKTTGDLPRKEIQLDLVLNEIVESLKYLLEGKEVRLDLNTSPVVIGAPEAPLRIVLSNLVRNAFLHTSRGSVAVTQSGNVVTIINLETDGGGDGGSGSPGFGFGLSLTSKLISKMDWSWQNEHGPAGHKAVLCINK
ncbi:MAG: HAMP domain-containing histidine kinase [Desulfobacter sp.]|nr:MAG: HAMP domain-containing histidine kinase [Desulfobacter sp.]